MDSSIAHAQRSTVRRRARQLSLMAMTAAWTAARRARRQFSITTCGNCGACGNSNEMDARRARSRKPREPRKPRKAPQTRCSSASPTSTRQLRKPRKPCSRPGPGRSHESLDVAAGLQARERKEACGNCGNALIGESVEPSASDGCRCLPSPIARIAGMSRLGESIACRPALGMSKSGSETSVTVRTRAAAKRESGALIRASVAGSASWGVDHRSP